MDTQFIALIVILGLAAFVVGYLFFGGRAPDEEISPEEAEGKEPKAKERDEKTPSADVLEDRMEVEGPVEIHEGMTLAEIKKAKAARIKGDKGRRETAVEATEKAKKEHGDEEEVEEEDEAADEEVDEGGEEVEEETLEAVSAGWEALEESFAAEAGEEEEEEEPEEVAEEPEEVAKEPEEEEIVEEEPTSLEKGLEKTRVGFIERLSSFFQGDQLDEDLVEEVEEVLYTSDVGPQAATDILEAVEERLSGDEKNDPQAVWEFVRDYVRELLESREEPLEVEADGPFVIIVIGVNGVGKTTTIGKMASKFKRDGKSVLLVAGDTFRAAAVEQIEIWGERTGVAVHAGEEKADPASVVYAGVERAVEEDIDVVICDTAGRLHTKQPLLDELGKIGRVTTKVIDEAPHETILVLDANTGQNAIQQAKMFREALDITGIVLTKLDGTAKGGVILGICDELDAPIRYIGIGEGVADLRPFYADEFVEALFM